MKNVLLAVLGALFLLGAGSLVLGQTVRCVIADQDPVNDSSYGAICADEDCFEDAGDYTNKICAIRNKDALDPTKLVRCTKDSSTYDCDGVCWYQNTVDGGGNPAYKLCFKTN